MSDTLTRRVQLCANYFGMSMNDGQVSESCYAPSALCASDFSQSASATQSRFVSARQAKYPFQTRQGVAILSQQRSLIHQKGPFRCTPAINCHWCKRAIRPKPTPFKRHNMLFYPLGHQKCVLLFVTCVETIAIIQFDSNAMQSTRLHHLSEFGRRGPGGR